MAAKMMAIILAFTFGGRYLDLQFEENYPVGTLIGSILGATLAVYSMIRDLK